MGYTNYNEFKKGESSKEEFKAVLVDCSKIIANKGDIGIFGEYGTGNPEFTETGICFNGDVSHGLAHEAFYFAPEESYVYSFCKTEKKPYDLIVGSVLISLANRMKGFKFSSDGQMAEWQPIFNFYESNVAMLSKAKKQKLSNWIK